MYNVIVVDDERYIRNGIVSLVDWNKLGCSIVAECANGLEAIKYMQEHPVDIVVSDIKMPGMDGLQLAEYMKENEMVSKIIILTAYSEFEYAQKAIKNNVVDFVVKTDFIEELPKSIQKTIQLIHSDRKVKTRIEELEETIQENLVDIKDRLIMDIIRGIIVEEKDKAILLSDKELKNKNYCLITMEVDISCENKVEPNKDRIRPNSTLTVYNTIKNFVTMVFKQYKYTIIPLENNVITTVIYLDENKHNQIKNIIILCNEILFVIEEFMRFSIKIGVSKIHTQVDTLNQAYKESLGALGRLLGNNNSIAVYSIEDDEGGNKGILDIEPYIQKIDYAVRQQSLEEAIDKLQQLIQEIIMSKVSFEQAKTYILIVSLECLRIVANYDISHQEYNLKETALYKKINKSKSLESLYKVASDNLNYVIQLGTTQVLQGNALVREIIKYIKTNYSKDISLNTIASYLHVSSSYISRLYKKETGESIIESLNKHRIEVAKAMLRQPNIKIFEVGAEVGIEDPGYFTHVFTKFVGMSPKEFKSKY